MSHLSLETIARLVDDQPNTAETAHLGTCAECRARLDEMREDVHALAMLPDMAAAPDDWAALEQRLTDEGLIRTTGRPRFGWNGRLMQIAAALTLFIGGTLAGRMMAPQAGTVAVDAASPIENPGPARASAPDAALASDVGPQAPLAEPSARPSASLASNVGLGRPGTVAEAAQLLRETEAVYLEALTRYAELATQSESGDPVARLAALQSIIMTTQAALNETPTDPVINGYHLTALAQRDATLRQVAAASSERWY
jgi:hypothetical protein